MKGDAVARRLDNIPILLLLGERPAAGSVLGAAVFRFWPREGLGVSRRRVDGRDTAGLTGLSGKDGVSVRINWDCLLGRLSESFVRFAADVTLEGSTFSESTSSKMVGGV